MLCREDRLGAGYRPVRVPTVLTPEEARKVIVAMSGTPQLVIKLIYGGGLRLLEALRLRVRTWISR